MKYRTLGRTGLEGSLVSSGSGGPSKLWQNIGLSSAEQDNLVGGPINYGGIGF